MPSKIVPRGSGYLAKIVPRGYGYLAKKLDDWTINGFLVCMMVAMVLTAVLCFFNKWSVVANIAATLVAGVLAGLVGYVVTDKWVAPLLLRITREEMAAIAVYNAAESDRISALDAKREAREKALQASTPSVWLAICVPAVVAMAACTITASLEDRLLRPRK